MIGRRTTVAGALAVALALGAAASPYAAGSPDGLERVAADHGFGGRATTGATQMRSPAAGYAVAGIDDGRLAAGAAGLAGTLVAGGAALGAGAALRRRRRT